MRKTICFLAILALALAPRHLRGQVGAQTKTLYVPIVAHLPAAGGNSWASDLRLYNPTHIDATASLAFLFAGKDNSATTEVSVTIGSGRALLLDDAVAKTFGLMESYGAIRIRSDVSLVGSSSTYLKAGFGYPGVTEPRRETFQTPAVDETEWNSAATRVLSVANRFRDVEAGPSVRDSYTNLGLLNPTADAVSVSLTLVDEARSAPLGTKTLLLPPYGFTQVTDLFEVFGVSDVQTENAILLIVAAQGLPPAFQPSPIVAYAVRQTETFDSCGNFSRQADFLLAQRIP